MQRLKRLWFWLNYHYRRLFPPHDYFGTLHEANLSGKVPLIYAHFDYENKIDPYVIEALRRYAEDFGVQIIFVTSSKLSAADIKMLSAYATAIIERPNFGLDFFSWRAGLNFLNSKLAQHQSVILTNDSVYGPLFPIDRFINEIFEAQIPMVGAISKSDDIEDHLQSYFLVVNKKAIPKISHFFKSLGIAQTKWLAVKYYEVGLSLFLNSTGVKLQSLTNWQPTESTQPRNPTHMAWQKLIYGGSPFIKVDLVRTNPLSVEDLHQLPIICEKFNYPIRLINDHVARVTQYYRH